MASTSLNEQHDVVFRWPSTRPKQVILTGSFDNWSKSIQLPRTPNGFETRIRLPYGKRTPYKFVVDGKWLVDQSKPTEYDNIGNLNNIYNPPPRSPPTTPIVVGEYENSKETASPSTKKVNGTAKDASRLSLSDFANTVVARDGTTSAFEYVKSGLGAVIGGVVGVDPINAGQTAVPPTPHSTTFNTSIPTSPTPPLLEPQTQMAPNVPIPIVPVNAPENSTVVNGTADSGHQHTHSPVVSPIKPSPIEEKLPSLASESKPEEANGNAAHSEATSHAIIESEDSVPPAPEEPTPSEEVVVPPPAPVAPEESAALPPSNAVPQESTSLPSSEPAPEESTSVPAPAIPEESTSVPTTETVPNESTSLPTSEAVPEESTSLPTPEAVPEESTSLPTSKGVPEESTSVPPAPEASTSTPARDPVDRPSTPKPPAESTTAAAASKSASLPPPAPVGSASSAPSTPHKKSGHFKRGSLSGAFGSLKGRKEGKVNGDSTANGNGTTNGKARRASTGGVSASASSTSGSSNSGDGEGGKKKKKESIFKKIKRVLTPHHHHHHHHHEEEKEKEGTKV